MGRSWGSMGCVWGFFGLCGLCLLSGLCWLCWLCGLCGLCWLCWLCRLLFAAAVCDCFGFGLCSGCFGLFRLLGALEAQI